MRHHILQVKYDINHQALKKTDLHFVKSDFFHSLEVVDKWVKFPIL